MNATLMHSIAAHAAMQVMLDKFNQRTEIRNATGKVLGLFAPAEQLPELLFLEAAAHFGPQENDRRKASGGTKYTTHEVLAHLDSMERP